MKTKKLNIGIVFFVLIGVLPFLAAFIYALCYSLGIIGVLNNGFTLDFWQAVFQSGSFFQSFLYSFAIAFVSMGISIGLALWLSLKFIDELNKKWISLIIFLPLAIPGVVAAFFTNQLFSKTGFFSRLMYHFNWITEARAFPDLVNDQWAFGITLTFITVVTPFFVLLFLNVYKNERIGELSELAVALGASPKQVTFKVSLPLLIRKTWTLIGLYFIFLLGAYEVPLILGQESPQMLSVYIVREIKQFDLAKIPEGYVVAVLYTLIVSAATIVLFSVNKRKEVAYD